MKRALFLLATLCFGAASAFAQDERTPAPYEIARTLQTLQAQITEGNAPAVAAQRALLTEMEKQFLAADVSVWQDARNARAAVVYTLSGGSPRVMRHLAALDPRPQLDENLALGALAYVEGNHAEARERLMKIDARALPASLGGQVALVQAGLIAQSDLKGAIRLLDDARLLMPGTLVDEAALRREVFMVAQARDIDRFEYLSGHYLRHFNSSIYAADFRQRFAAAITRFDLAEDSAHFQRLRALLDASDVDDRRAQFLYVARSSALHGKVETARLAAAQAESLSALGSSDGVRARLYGAAAGILTEDYPRHADELNTINRRQLTEADNALLDAALSAAAAIRYWPDIEGGRETISAVLADPARGADWVTPLMQRAATGLEAAAKLLQEAPKK